LFGANPPAATLVEVKRLLHPEMMIAIEADAFAPNADGESRSQGRSAPAKHALARRKTVTKASHARR